MRWEAGILVRWFRALVAERCGRDMGVAELVEGLIWESGLMGWQLRDREGWAKHGTSGRSRLGGS